LEDWGVRGKRLRNKTKGGRESRSASFSVKEKERGTGCAVKKTVEGLKKFLMEAPLKKGQKIFQCWELGVGGERRRPNPLEEGGEKELRA